LLQQRPQILVQAVLPMEKIDAIRIFQVGGLPGVANSNMECAANGTSGGDASNPSASAAFARPWPRCRAICAAFCSRSLPLVGRVQRAQAIRLAAVRRGRPRTAQDDAT
jgi:hypothetical protein